MAGVPTLGRMGAPGRSWPRGRADGRAWPCVAAVAAPVAVLAVLLLAMGREPWCTCGHVKLWHGVVRSPGNSQHLTDWYTFAHVLDGFGFHLALRLLGRAWPPPLRLTRATTLAAAWEVVENSDFVIDHFRAATLALGYRGDSIVNSVGDVLACVLGFALAGLLPVRRSVPLAAALGLLAGWVVYANPNVAPKLITPIEATQEGRLGP